MTLLLVGLGLLLSLPALCVRLTPLAPTRLGAVFYYSNVFSELFAKRTPLPQGAVELAGLVLGLAAMAVACWPGAVAAAVVASTVTALELWNLRRERRMLTVVYAREDFTALERQRRGPDARLRRGSPSPVSNPELVLSLQGPFVARMPRLDLGDLTLGRSLTLTLLVANHSTVPTQDGGEVRFGPCHGVTVSPERVSFDPLGPGDVARLMFTVQAEQPSAGGQLELELLSADQRETRTVRVRSVFQPRTGDIADARVQRYPGGCRAAFAWRGDMDLYDTGTFQSMEGLETTLGLGARYRVPQTMYLSTRLSLDQAEASRYFDHYGVQRGQQTVDAFVKWLRENVDLVHRASYPFNSTKPYLLELGNHGHLHYGTDAAAAAENNWTPMAKMGAGTYPWVDDDASSFGEQRDNALKARERCESLLGFTPRSWAMPDRTSDGDTPRAMEAAGCEVLSDSDVRTADNVLWQPPPHFSRGTGAVELTKRYPGDPQSLNHVAMITYWIHRAHRRGIPVLFMCHQHMLQFMTRGCERFTEHVLRYVLTRFNGDLHINTVYGIGVYWRDLLAPTPHVTVGVQDGAIRLDSSAEQSYAQVPVDVIYRGGQRCTLLVDIPAGQRVEVA